MRRRGFLFTNTVIHEADHQVISILVEVKENIFRWISYEARIAAKRVIKSGVRAFPIGGFNIDGNFISITLA